MSWDIGRGWGGLVGGMSSFAPRESSLGDGGGGGFARSLGLGGGGVGGNIRLILSVLPFHSLSSTSFFLISSLICRSRDRITRGGGCVGIRGGAGVWSVVRT